MENDEKLKIVSTILDGLKSKIEEEFGEISVEEEVLYPMISGIGDDLDIVSRENQKCLENICENIFDFNVFTPTKTKILWFFIKWRKKIGKIRFLFKEGIVICKTEEFFQYVYDLRPQVQKLLAVEFVAES